MALLPRTTPSASHCCRRRRRLSVERGGAAQVLVNRGASSPVADTDDVLDVEVEAEDVEAVAAS